MVNSKLVEMKECRRSLEEFKLENILSNDECIIKKFEEDNKNVRLHYAPSSNRGGEHLVEGQA